MAQNKLAEYLQGNNKSAGFIQSYSKKNLALPWDVTRTGRQPRKGQQVVRYTQIGNWYYIILWKTELRDRWDGPPCVLLLLLLTAVQYVQPEDLAQKK